MSNKSTLIRSFYEKNFLLYKMIGNFRYLKKVLYAKMRSSGVIKCITHYLSVIRHKRKDFILKRKITTCFKEY